MNIRILDRAVQDYINSQLNADVNHIALMRSSFTGVSSAELATQIAAKKKSEKKLPSWFKAAHIYYPPTLSIEQTSSEITAKYKAKLAQGTLLLDLTGGFGVDSFYFAKNINEVIHCEINSELSSIASHNAKILKALNITFRNEDGIEFIKKTDLYFDTIYIDPARRAEKGKVFMLNDCSPDVPENLELMLSKTKRVIIKTSPLLDITAGLAELSQVSEIHILSLKNECKEILWVIEKGFKGKIKVVAVTLNQSEKKFIFFKSEAGVLPEYEIEIMPGNYLYEPDAALLKSGAFNLIGVKYNLQKLHPQTQLYSSATLNTIFPGRIFKIEEILSTNDLKKQKSLTGNVIVRNYPAKPEELIKKFKIRSDKNSFLVFTKNSKNENLVIRTQIVQFY